MKRRSYIISRFICPDCGLVMPLPRYKGKQKEHGHVKDIWCPGCYSKKKFVEVRNWESIGTLADS